MSHFCVMIIGDDWEEQLARFQENNMGDCPPEFMEFFDIEDERQQDWMQGLTKRVITPEGEMLRQYDDQFKHYPDPEKRYKSEYVYPEGYELKEVPNTEIWPTFEQYMSEWHGHDERDSEMGRYGYWENPAAKWDWYQVGGRWSGYFKAKPGVDLSKYHVSEAGLMTSQPRDGYGDQLLKGEIDLEGMYKEAMNNASERYDKFEKATKGLPIPPKWSEVREGCTEIEEAREIWNNYPWVKALKENNLMPFWADAHEAFFVDNGGREAYIENSKCEALVPFALLMDYTWYEKGEMGWWGMVSNEKLQYDWATEFKLMFEALSDDTLITLVDCHI